MITTTTQATAMKFSDFFFFQQPGVIYGLVIVLIAVGAAFWLFGHRLHRTLLTVMFLSAGILTGWYVGPIYGVNALLAMVIGGLLGAGIGYWFFHFWLGLFSSGLIFLLLFSVYAWHIAGPYLSQAAQESRQEMLTEGIQLAPGTGDKPQGPDIPPSDTPVGSAWRELQSDLPKLSRAQYQDWQSWQEQFLPTLARIWERLQVIIPRLSLNTILLGGVAVIFGGILALLRPIFLNIAYTSLLGILLTSSGLGILLTLRDTDQFYWLEGQYWIIPIILLAIWGIGIGLQYWLLPSPPPMEDEEGEDEDDAPAENPKGDKKKK